MKNKNSVIKKVGPLVIKTGRRDTRRIDENRITMNKIINRNILNHFLNIKALKN